MCKKPPPDDLCAEPVPADDRNWKPTPQCHHKGTFQPNSANSRLEFPSHHTVQEEFYKHFSWFDPNLLNLKINVYTHTHFKSPLFIYSDMSCFSSIVMTRLFHFNCKCSRDGVRDSSACAKLQNLKCE